MFKSMICTKTETFQRSFFAPAFAMATFLVWWRTYDTSANDFATFCSGRTLQTVRDVSIPHKIKA